MMIKKNEIQQNIYMAYNTCLATSSNRYHIRCSWLFFQCRTKRSVTQRYVLIQLHLQIVVLSVVLGCFFNVVQNARLPKGMFSLRLEMKDRSAFGGKSCE